MNARAHRVRAALIAALVLAGLAGPARAQAGLQAEAREFSPPDAPLVLTRELRRPLADGHEVVSRRRYQVQFQRQDAGYVVDGLLLEAQVDAPEELRMLADLERARPDTGLFPIRLDADGMLATNDEGPSPEPGRALSAGIELVSQQLRRMNLPAMDARQAQAFVRQFLSRPGMTPWPLDLFRPAPGRHSDSREVALPDGIRGEVTVETNAETEPATGLLARFDRIVTTRVENDTRRTFETWRLTMGAVEH